MPNRSPIRAANPVSVVVTGAWGGIGLATALRLAADGARVFAGVRSPATARRLRDAQGPALHPVVLDVSGAGSCASAMARITEALGGRPMTALVNNAAIAFQRLLETLPNEDLIAQFEVNLIDGGRMVQAALPLQCLEIRAPGL